MSLPEQRCTYCGEPYYTTHTCTKLEEPSTGGPTLPKGVLVTGAAGAPGAAPSPNRQTCARCGKSTLMNVHIEGHGGPYCWECSGSVAKEAVEVPPTVYLVVANADRRVSSVWATEKDANEVRDKNNESRILSGPFDVEAWHVSGLAGAAPVTLPPPQDVNFGPPDERAPHSRAPMTPDEVLRTAWAVRECSESWAPNVRLLGNVRAEDVSRLCTWAAEELGKGGALPPDEAVSTGRLASRVGATFDALNAKITGLEAEVARLRAAGRPERAVVRAEILHEVFGPDGPARRVRDAESRLHRINKALQDEVARFDALAEMCEHKSDAYEMYAAQAAAIENIRKQSFGDAVCGPAPEREGEPR